MTNPETEQLWRAIRTLTYAVMDLAKASVELVDDPKVLDRLRPFYEQLGELSKLHAAYCQTKPEVSVEANDDLREIVADLAEKFEERERDRNRDVVITLVKELPHA